MNYQFIPGYLMVIFLLVAGILFLIFKLSINGTKSRRVKGKHTIYACGEDIDPEELNVYCKSFFKTLVQTFNLEFFKKIHTGDLTTYLLWIFVGLIILLITLVVFW